MSEDSSDIVNSVIHTKQIEYLSHLFCLLMKVTDKNGNLLKEKYTSTAGRFLLANILPKNHNIKFALVSLKTCFLKLILIFSLIKISYMIYFINEL